MEEIERSRFEEWARTEVALKERTGLFLLIKLRGPLTPGVILYKMFCGRILSERYNGFLVLANREALDGTTNRVDKKQMSRLFVSLAFGVDQVMITMCVRVTITLDCVSPARVSPTCR